MLLTEEKARKRWCPFARVTDNGCATNRHAGEKTNKDGRPKIFRTNARCVAYECMAWRWLKDPKLNEEPAYKQLGYCGLAGKPYV